MGASNPYMTLGNPSDVTNTNPYTSGFYNALGGISNFAQQGINFNPLAGYNAFLGMAPQLQGLVSGLNSPYAENQLNLADIQSNQAVNDVFGNYANSGMLHSGAAIAAATKAAESARLGAVGNILGAQNQLAGGLLSSALSAIPAAYTSTSGQASNLLANALGMQGQIAAPEWWQPTYAQNPDYMSTKDWLGTGAGILGLGAQLALAPTTGGGSLLASLFHK